MDDEQLPPRKVFPFELRKNPAPPVQPQPPAGPPAQPVEAVSATRVPHARPIQKFGIYPLGDGGADLIMSFPVFATVIEVMEKGTNEDRVALATRLRELFNATFV